SVSVSTSEAHLGTNNGIIRSNATTHDWGAVNQFIVVKTNTWYVASAWIRTSSNYSSDGSLRINTDYPELTLLNNVFFVSSADYHQYSVRFNVPSDASPTARVVLNVGYHGFGEEAWVRVDDFAVTEEAGPHGQ